MKVYVVELHDANVRVFHGDELICQSPGYALVNPSGVEVGSAAFQQARLHPRQVNHQFWQRLSTDPVSQKTNVVRHYADIAYAHLKHLAEYFEAPAAVIFAVPSGFSSEQLSLLTGIAQACSFQVVGLVDSAVAKASVSELPTEINVMLDMQLHRTDICVLAANSVVQRKQVESINVGLVKLYDKWIQVIADAFIEQCRFDPLHNAVTEQALSLKLTEWLATISTSDEVVLDIASSGQSFQARLQTAQAIEQVVPFYRQLVAALDDACAGAKYVNILVGEEASNLPGFCKCLPVHKVVPVNAVSLGCTQHFDFIRGLNDSGSAPQEKALHFVTALPAAGLNHTGDEVGAESVAEIEQSPVVSAKEEKTVGASHVLHGVLLYGLTRPLYIGEYANSEAEDLQLGYSAHEFSSLSCAIIRESLNPQLRVLNSAAVLVNGESVVGNRGLKLADKITFDSSAMELQIMGEVSNGSPT